MAGITTLRMFGTLRGRAAEGVGSIIPYQGPDPATGWEGGRRYRAAMPEGDTIHNTAARLRPALEGAVLLGFEARRMRAHRPRPGWRIESVQAVGKHLMIRFERDLVLHTHMQMTGSWHLYATGERWRKPAHLSRAVLAVEGWQAVCFSAPVVETFVIGHDPDPTAHLGPDLCGADPDLDLAVDRFALVDEGTQIGPALVDQRIAAGIGNVYKSETLFACGLDPFVPVAEVGSEQRRQLLEAAHRQLRMNLGRNDRQTVPGGLAVYGRANRPCRVCGVGIRVDRQGDQSRTTYWCPRCQISRSP